jgi:hypothetical protein
MLVLKMPKITQVYRHWGHTIKWESMNDWGSCSLRGQASHGDESGVQIHRKFFRQLGSKWDFTLDKWVTGGSHRVDSIRIVSVATPASSHFSGSLVVTSCSFAYATCQFFPWILSVMRYSCWFSAKETFITLAYLFFYGSEMEPRALHMVGKCWTSETPQPPIFVFTCFICFMIFVI